MGLEPGVSVKLNRFIADCNTSTTLRSTKVKVPGSSVKTLGVLDNLN